MLEQGVDFETEADLGQISITDYFCSNRDQKFRSDLRPERKLSVHPGWVGALYSSHT
jgi:hypothetical protein